MKVKAETNINYNGEWLNAGMTFDVDEADLASLDGMVKVVGKPATKPAPVKEEVPAEAEKAPEDKKEEPAKPKTTSTRKRKASD